MSTAWYRQVGSEGDVVLSTRVRLARNLTGFPFPDRMNAAQKQDLKNKVFAALKDDSESLRLFDVAALPRREAVSLAERHLISPAFAECDGGSALFLSEDEGLSLMVNEEDHLRLQTFGAGLCLEECLARADEMDSRLCDKLHFAFSDRLGYLTQCPTNLGTGMRASVMLHLPALTESKTIPLLAGTVSKLGLTIRGLYGEGTRAEGAVYQLSNQVTLGITEKEAVENLKGVAMQIVGEERRARERICRDPAYEDRIWRALGVLKTARLLNHKECMHLLSLVQIGASMGLLDVPADTVTALLTDVQPATLATAAGKDLDAGERDTARAALVRERL